MAFSRLRVWAGTEVVVEEDHVGVVGGRHTLQVLRLCPCPDRSSCRCFAPLGDLADDCAPGRFGQASQFFQRMIFALPFGQQHAHQNRRFADDPSPRFISVTIGISLQG